VWADAMVVVPSSPQVFSPGLSPGFFTRSFAGFVRSSGQIYLHHGQFRLVLVYRPA
jgi:hypothetical protein